MPASPWERLYSSPWHNPGFFWLAGALFLLALGLRVGGLRGFLLIFGLEILADCTLTGGWTPIPPGSSLGTPVSVAFVILGDLRYFLLIEAVRGGEGLTRGPLRRAAALSFVVPLVVFGLRSAVPALLAMRPFFLVYESLLFALALAHGLHALHTTRRVHATGVPVMPGNDEHPRDAIIPPGTWTFMRALLTFELAQYGLWVLSDVLILGGFEPGHALRIVPNSMYYAFFLPFVWWRAPRGELPA